MRQTAGDKIKALREKAGLEQKDVAKSIGVGRTSVANWESGQTPISAQRLADLADFFNTSVDYLMGRTDNPKGA